MNSTTLSQKALLDLLGDGRLHLRKALETAVAGRMARPYTNLTHDLAALRQAGWRIAYSRGKGMEGYYLQCPPRIEELPRWQEPLNPLHIALIQALSPAQKVARAMASAEFALSQRRLLLAEMHPDWSAEQIDREARRIVYRVPPQERELHVGL